MSILHTELAQETAAAILTENPEILEALWLETGDSEKMSLLTRGELLCEQMLNVDDTERFRKIYSALKRGSIERRIAELKSMPPDKRDQKELMTLYAQRLNFSR